MKNSVIILFAAISQFFIIAKSEAQESIFQIGLKGGINYSKLNFDDVKDESSKTGYHIGAFATLNLNENFAIQPEVLYTTKGAKAEFQNVIINGTSSFVLNYIELPILAVFRLNKNINIHGGPYFSLLVNAKAKNESQSTQFNFSEEVDKNNFQNTDWGLTGGIGFDIASFHVGARYSRGMVKIENEQFFDGTSYKFKDATNSQFQIYGGFHF